MIQCIFYQAPRQIHTQNQTQTHTILLKQYLSSWEWLQRQEWAFHACV